VIVIENGGLIVANNAAITALRTAIVLTGNNAYGSAIDFPNGNGKSATLTISPPTNASNPWQGFSLYQDPALTNGRQHLGPRRQFLRRRYRLSAEFQCRDPRQRR
jgi:hypothetical protein